MVARRQTKHKDLYLTISENTSPKNTKYKLEIVR